MGCSCHREQAEIYSLAALRMGHAKLLGRIRDRKKREQARSLGYTPREYAELKRVDWVCYLAGLAVGAAGMLFVLAVLGRLR